MNVTQTEYSQRVETQLERILRSRTFAGSQRSQRFLRFVTESSLRAAEDPNMDLKAEPIKEYTIALEVFERDTSYDPAVDATVRVEAGRLRSRLREYYAEEGKDDPLIIEMPKGGYRVTFSENSHASSPVVVGEEKASSDDTGGARKARWGVWAAIAAVVLCALGLWRWEHYRATELPRGTIAIAVLPIVNQTGDAGADYISDGVTESSIQQLSGIAGLRVIGSGSVARYRGAQQDVRSVGRTLGVDTVLQGRLRRDNGRLMLVTELCRVSDGSVLLSREYLPEDKDLQPVQADMIRDTLETLRIDTGAELSKSGLLRAHTNSPAAYEEFLRGEAVARGDSPPEFHEAIQHFEKATALDSSFDLAWLELAQAHLMLGVYFEAPRDHMPVARRDAERALVLNPRLDEAHGILGVIALVYDWNFAAAVSELEPAESSRRAITSLACTIHLLDQTGRTRNAEEMVRRQLTYDPQSEKLISELGCVAYYHRHYDEAVQSYTAAMEKDPNSPLPYWGLGKSLTQLGRYQQAIEVFDRFSQRNGVTPPMLTAESGYSLAKWGKKKEAKEHIEQLLAESRNGFVDPFFIALIHLGLGDREETFAWLAKAEEVRSPFLISTLTDPKWEELLSDPRFGPMVARLSAKGSAV